MDPNETLRRLLEWANGEDTGTNSADAMEMFLDLHNWIVNKGMLPDDWRLLK